MACPTCDHTMTGVSAQVFWCPRCGTIKDERGFVGPPSLVKRCEIAIRKIIQMKIGTVLDVCTERGVEITATKRSGDWHACLRGQTGFWESGRTVEDAVESVERRFHIENTRQTEPDG